MTITKKYEYNLGHMYVPTRKSRLSSAEGKIMTILIIEL